MNTTSVIKKLTAAGLKVVQMADSNRYFAKTQTDTISWIDQGGSAICLKVACFGDHDDIQSDYHAGVYADSITQALKLAGVKVENTRRVFNDLSALDAHNHSLTPLPVA